MRLSAILFGLALSCAAAHADTASDLKASIESNTKGKVVVTSVAPTAVNGIFEVVSGAEIFYVDSSGRYGFVDGRMMDLREGVDLTAQRLDIVSRIDFRKLPLHLAIKEVRGSGKREMAIFEDPGCPVCRVLSKFVSQLEDVTVYHFMLPVTDPTSIPKVKAVWCLPAKEKLAAWKAVMQGANPPQASDCDFEGLQRAIELADALHIEGTPTVFLANGRRLVGATPPDHFVAALDESAKAK